MTKRPAMTLQDVRRAIEAQNRKLAAASESAKASGVRSLPVTEVQLRQLAEASEPRVPPPSNGVLTDWRALRC